MQKDEGSHVQVVIRDAPTRIDRACARPPLEALPPQRVTGTSDMSAAVSTHTHTKEDKLRCGPREGDRPRRRDVLLDIRHPQVDLPLQVRPQALRRPGSTASRSRTRENDTSGDLCGHLSETSLLWSERTSLWATSGPAFSCLGENKPRSGAKWRRRKPTSLSTTARDMFFGHHSGTMRCAAILPVQECYPSGTRMLSRPGSNPVQIVSTQRLLLSS